MSKIGSKNTQQEFFVRKLIHSMGFRYRLHRKDLPGKPDIAFPTYKKIIFVNGCFWHGHKGCKRSALPSANRAFWKKKIENNMSRDKQNYTRLKKLGWDYLVIRQCEIKDEKKELLGQKIKQFLTPPRRQGKTGFLPAAGKGDGEINKRAGTSGP